MPSRLTLLLTLLLTFSLLLPLSTFSIRYSPAYGAAAPEQSWPAAERAALPGTGRLISVPLDPSHPQKGNFDLYYFSVSEHSDGKTEKPYILFVAGGPGQVVLNLSTRDGPLDFLSDYYNIVYFHLRGSGLSQLPPSNRFDRFLRTRFAVEDIEAIRRSLGENIQWHALVGDSYGTVLVQQYAARYPENVKKTILLAPLSRGGFSPTDWKNLSQHMRHKRLDTLQRIYNSDLFKNCLPQHTIDYTIETVRNISDKIDEEFGNLGFVTVAYDQLGGKLQEVGLNYDAQFFRALGMLRQIGWLPQDTIMRDWRLSSIQKGAAWQIAFSVATAWYNQNQPLGPYFSPEHMLEALREDGCREFPLVKWLEKSRQFFSHGPSSSLRTYYVMWNYDGLNSSVLYELQQGENFSTALENSSGRARANFYVSQVGIVPGVAPSPWDPALCKHNRPTLIMKGGADPVTVGRQPEYILDNALIGARMLIEFPGVGHAMVLPEINVERPDDGKGPCHDDAPGGSAKSQVFIDLKECLLYSFMKPNFQDFEASPLLSELPQKFPTNCRDTKECVTITTKAPPLPDATPQGSVMCVGTAPRPFQESRIEIAALTPLTTNLTSSALMTAKRSAIPFDINHRLF